MTTTTTSRQRGIPATEQTAAARRGEFTAEFPCHAHAVQFMERLARPGNWAADARLNRRNGRIVTFTATEAAYTCTRLTADPTRDQGILGYWLDMADAAGAIGSTPGEYPDHAGAKTAYLNGRPCPPEY
jgi:hypothetical protein